MNDNSKQLGRNTLLYLIAQMLPKIVGFIMVPIYTKYIIPEELGIYTYTSSIVTLLTVLSAFGMNVYYLRNYSRSEDKRAFNGSIFGFVFLWNVVLAGILMLLLPTVWKLLNVSFDFWPFMPMAILYNFFCSMELIPMRAYRIRGEANKYLQISVGKAIATGGFGFFFVVVLGETLYGRYFADLATGSIFAIIFIIYMFRNSDLHINWKIVREGIKFSKMIIPSDVVQVSSTTINSMIVEHLLSLAQLGIYSIGATIANVVGTVTQSITFAFEPEFYIAGGKPEFPAVVKNLKKTEFLIADWVCVGAGLFVREAVYVFLNEKYWNAWPVVQSIAISYTFLMLRTVFSQIAITQGKTKLLLIANSVSLISIVAFNYIILPIVGESGIGWSNSASYILAFLIYYFSIDKSEMQDLNLSTDFLCFAICIFVVYISNLFNSLGLAICIACKLLVFVIFNIVIFAIYRIRVSTYFEIIKNKISK